MTALSVLAFLAHTLVLVRAVVFFRKTGAIRDRDKHGVAAVATLSLLFLATHLLSWGSSPAEAGRAADYLVSSMFQAYNLAVAIVFIGHLQVGTERRSRRQCSEP